VTRASNKFFFGVGLLVAGGIVIAFFRLPWDENHPNPGASSVRPHVLFDNDPRVVAYQLQRLSKDQLVRVERNDTDPKYRPVYEAFLVREDVPNQYRHEAISALANLNYSDAITETVGGMERVGDHSPGIQAELADMLLRREPHELAAARDLLEKTAATSEIVAARRASYAALAMTLPADELWQLAVKGNRDVEDLLRAIPMVLDTKRRDTLYGKVEPLLYGDAPAELRRAAIEILPSFTVHEKESFATLASFVRRDIERPAAIQSLLEIRKEHWADGEIPPLADAIVEYALDVPPNERTEPAFLEAIELGNQLAPRLSADAGGRIRRILDDLGVTVIRLHTLIDQTSYDKRLIVVEAGKRIEIVLENQDFMPHNLVLTLPGAREEIGLAADKMPRPARPDSQGRYHVPASPKVLQATGLLEPGQIQKLNFEAPKEPGDYPYLCTFNGHWRRMFGYLRVVEDMEEYLRNPQPVTDLGYTEWKLSDLVDDLVDIDAERSDEGQDIFDAASCIKCHRAGQLGKDFCPDLTDVFERYEQDAVRVLAEILEPSKNIEEKYMNHLFVLTSGEVATGIVTAEDVNSLTVQSSGDDSQAVTIDKRDIVERDKRSVSIMPVGILDTFRRDQIVDLLSFLKYGGNATKTDSSTARQHSHGHQ
jgi:putative heme-binding domain-containing protein